MDITQFGTPETNQLLINLFLTALTLIVSVVSRAVLTNIKSRTNDTQWGVFLDIVRTAVYASEQGAIAGIVKDKKASALNIITRALAERGITIDPAIIDATIEATVLEEFNRVKVEREGGETTPTE